MSKKILAVILITGLAVGTGWWLWQAKQRQKNQSFIQKEVRIEETSLPEFEYSKYQDYAGFEFEYADSLEITEVELENSQVYSTLELTGVDGKTMKLRVYDDNRFESVEAWLNQFEEKNVVVNLENILWVDIEAVRFNYEMGSKKMTVAIEDGVIYQLDSPSDQGGFWDTAHDHLINSFKFDASAYGGKLPAETSSEDENILLLEETVVEE